MLNRDVESRDVEQGPGLAYKRCQRGCSSMVEQKLPKLTTGVRFPSPAPALVKNIQRFGRQTARMPMQGRCAAAKVIRSNARACSSTAADFTDFFSSGTR